jgi:hypothetical protein
MENAGHLPTQINAGETIWLADANTAQGTEDIVYSDYTPGDGYTLAYQFASDTPITVDAAANGDDTGWTLTVTAAQTLAWNAGTLAYAGYVTKTAGGHVTCVDSGTISVTASPLKVSAWKAVVASCDAAIANYAANPYGSIMIDGIQSTYRSLKQLTDLRGYAKSMLAADTANRPRRIIRTRFT